MRQLEDDRLEGLVRTPSTRRKVVCGFDGKVGIGLIKVLQCRLRMTSSEQGIVDMELWSLPEASKSLSCQTRARDRLRRQREMIVGSAPLVRG